MLTALRVLLAESGWSDMLLALATLANQRAAAYSKPEEEELAAQWQAVSGALAQALARSVSVEQMEAAARRNARA